MLTFQFGETTTGPTIDPVCLSQNENSLAKTVRNRSLRGCSSFWTARPELCQWHHLICRVL